MTTSTFQALIRTFGEQLGAVGMEGDDDGYIALAFDATAVHLQYDDQTGDIVVFTKLCEIDQDRIEEIGAMLLGANVFWQGADGATFSMDPVTRVVFLAHHRPLRSLDIAALNAWLERFLAIAEHWQRRLDSADTEHRDDASELGLHTYLQLA